jgi:hypothetical protein
MAKKQISTYKFIPGVIPPAYDQYPKAIALLVANQTFLINEMDQYIRNQIAANINTPASPWYGYTYDSTRSAKCKRDTQYVLDALIYDLTYGGNSGIYQVASRYYIQGVIQIINSAVEIATYNWLLGKITTNVLTNTLYTKLNPTTSQVILADDSEAGGITQTTALVTYVINTITTGTSALPAPVAPDTQRGGLMPNTVALLDANKRFIQEETIAYIAYNVANNLVPYQYYTYNAEKCRRDVSYVLEGYISDFKHGGNRQTIFNANKYWENGVPQVDGNRAPEIYAHTFIRDLIDNYIFTNTAFTNRQIVVKQVFDYGNLPEVFANTRVKELTNIILDVIQYGPSYLPTVISNRGQIKFPGYYKIKDLLLITNASRNTILYNFADDANAAEITYSETVDSDFPAALYGNDKITTITLDADTTGMMVTDNIQIFVEAKEQAVRLNPIATDAMERMRVGIPQSMLDADFEYGLQPTKWQAISLMRNYPSFYEIPGSDTSVLTVVTDASAGTGGTGASLITVTCVSAHGFAVNDPFTIKALANSVNGFSRAEGSFLVNSVTASNVFTYWAKSKVGTTNPTTLSSTYTQLRKAGFYTGASIGSPSFSVFSNGASGTITTSLITAQGADTIGFSSLPPPVGAPLVGTGIPAGAQVTAIYGTGGTAASTTLSSTAAIGDSTINVTSTTGISVGLVFNRGDGQAVTVTNITGNAVSLSGQLTSVINGTSQTYTALNPTIPTGTGAGAQVTVSRVGNTYSSTITTPGNGFTIGDTLVIPGTSVSGTTPANDVTITVDSVSPKNTVSNLDGTSRVPGTGYSDDPAAATTGGTGTGLTVSISTAQPAGTVTSITVVNPGQNYTAGDVITVVGGNNDCTIQVGIVNPGGLILTASTAGTPITAPTKAFVSAFTISDVTTSSIASGNADITYSAIPTIQIVFPGSHGFIPGNTITVQITSTDTGAQLAAGSYFVETVVDANTIRYTARAAGAISNTLTGYVYGRPDSYFVHRPFDGGVQLGTATPTHGATAIRMSKKYIRYQSGKGVMYNTGALFAPSYDLRSLTATGTVVGSVITVTTDDTDHGCQVGGVISISGVVTSGYNGVYTVSDIINERVFSIVAGAVLGSTTAVLDSPCIMSTRNWHGASVRSGIFDDQNGMFWQYDGIRMSVVRRSSTNQLAGSISVPANSNTVTGTNTRFTQQLASGDRIVIRGMTHIVSRIVSDTQLAVTPDYRGVNDAINVKAVKTIDIIIPQENWNIDTMNGSGQSGYNLDVTKMQMIGIQHTWYGAGFIDFMLRGSDGNYAFAHRFRNSNVNTEAYMRSGNQPVRYEVINEGAKDKLSAAMDATQTTIPLTNSYWFPDSGTVIVESELIRYTGNANNTLTGCVRGTVLTQFVAGAQRNFQGQSATTHAQYSGVILVSNTITPNISHWGSAFMIDGQFDSDRGYIFNYAATAITASADKSTAFLIRLAPSVSNAQTGDLGDKELLNRAQLLLSGIAIASDSVTGGGAIVVEGVLNPSNYPTDPTKITWNGLSSPAAGGQPSFCQIAAGGSVTWSGNVYTTTATVQGAFTTTLTAKSFAPIAKSLTAVSFGVVSQLANAPAITGVQNATYQFAFQNTRNDFLITNTAYDTLTAQTPLAIGDTLSVGVYLTSAQKIASITRNFITINAIPYTRIVMTANANASSATNTAVANVTFTSSQAAVYTSALSTARSDFLITQSQYVSLAPVITDVLTTATYLTGGQGISSITQSYATIAGVSYARIIMTGVANATSTAGGGNNVTVTSTSASTSTYGSALSTARSDFLITDTAYATSGIAIGDVLSLATYLTGGQTILSITQSYINIASVVYTRIVMSAPANATSTAGSGNDQSVLTTAAGSGATYVGRNYLFFTSSTWLASGAVIGTKIASSGSKFPAATSVAGIATRTFGGTTVYRITFTQTATATVSAADTITFQFGAPYAVPGEQVFSFITNPGNTDSLSLEALKELTSTAIGGRGTFPNGPDVLAINVYKVAGTATPVNIILRWGEAQA